MSVSSKLAGIFGNITGLPIAVVGDVMLDRYLFGSAERISPEAPVPVVRVTEQSDRLGGAANVALNLATLGATPLLFGACGEDYFAEKLRGVLEQHGICADLLVCDARRPTTTKTRIIAHGQQMLRIDEESVAELSDVTELELCEQVIESLRDVAGLIISDYAKGVATKTLLARVIPEARQHGVFVAVDPKRDTFADYRGASIITPNKSEAALASRVTIRDMEALTRAGFELLRASGADHVLITRGSDGMSLFTPDVSPVEFSTKAKAVYDVTGAGDTVIATVCAVASAGGSLNEACVVASHAAGIVVGKVGTATATPEEIADSINLKDSSRHDFGLA